MNPMINFLRKQKPEWEEYLNLMEMLENQKQDISDDIEETPQAKQIKVQDKKLKTQIIRLRKTQQKLQQSIEMLQDMLDEEIFLNEQLAEALGACPDCFGQDRDCESCNGLGKPGHYAPDFIGFNKYVSPAITKFRKYYKVNTH